MILVQDLVQLSLEKRIKQMSLHPAKKSFEGL